MGILSQILPSYKKLQTKQNTDCLIVAFSGLLLLPVLQYLFPEGSWWKEREIPGDFKAEALYSKMIVFYGVREIINCSKNVSGWSLWNCQSLLLCCDWLRVNVISYRAFGLLIGSLDQFCLLFRVCMRLLVLALSHWLIA